MAAFIHLIGWIGGLYVGAAFVHARVVRHHLRQGMHMKAAKYAAAQIIRGPKLMGE